MSMKLGIQKYLVLGTSRKRQTANALLDIIMHNKKCLDCFPDTPLMLFSNYIKLLTERQADSKLLQLAQKVAKHNKIMLTRMLLSAKLPCLNSNPPLFTSTQVKIRGQYNNVIIKEDHGSHSFKSIPVLSMQQITQSNREEI